VVLTHVYYFVMKVSPLITYINTRVMNYLEIYEFSRLPPSRNILTLEHRLFALLQLRDKE